MKTFSFVIRALRLWTGARRRKRETGVGFALGAVGLTETALAPDGFVCVGGEVWPAKAVGHIAPGVSVRVVGASGFRLTVTVAE